jgi:probable HAF family extracellular repeat protein
MKSRFLILLTAITLFAALAMPVRVAAQDKQNHHHKHHHYQLIDMGTFGGSESAVNFPVDLNDRGINKHAVTVGFSATATHRLPTSHPLICGGDDGYGSFITHAFRWQDGSVTDLGALPPEKTNCSNAYQVNASGEIAGFSENGELDPLLPYNQSRAVRWKDGQIEDLGSFGGNQNIAGGINNRGQIVGFSTNGILDPFSPNGEQTRAFLWQNGQMQDLGTLGGPDALATYINERGQIAGISYTSTTPNPVTGVPPLEPFLWENGKMLDLGTLGGAVGFVGGLNNRGQVIGVSSIAANAAACFTEFDPNCHPFLWSQDKLIDLNTSTIGGKPSRVAGINDAEHIVGTAAFPNASFDAYLWKNGVAIDLGHLAIDCFSEATAINSHSQVVGNSFSCDGNSYHAFLWENGSMIDLNAQIPAESPLQLPLAFDINARGEIAGIGLPPGVPLGNVFTEGDAFLLIPCDENNPNIEGCDYSLLDAPDAARVSPASVTQQPAALTPVSRMPARMLNRFRLPWGHRSLGSGTAPALDQKPERPTHSVTDDWVADQMLDPDSCFGYCHRGYCSASQDADGEWVLNGYCLGKVPGINFCSAKGSPSCPRGANAKNLNRYYFCGLGLATVDEARPCSF